jgi:hypothetical protein
MLRGRRATIAAALAIATAAAVTAGCGGGSSSALSLDPVAAAATKTQHAGAVRVRLAMAFNAPHVHKLIRLRGSGAIDGTSAKLTVGLGSLFRQTGIPASALPNATPAQLMHGSMTEVALEQGGDYVLYLKTGFLASQLPGGKQWVKLDVSKLGKAAGLDLGKLLSGSQFQPSDLLSMLKGEGAKISNLGSATVDGASTTHYRVTIDMAQVLQSKGLTSPLLGAAVAQMPELPEDVWVGKDGLVRRVGLSYSAPEGGKSMHLAMTMDLFDYGAHVTIAAPPSSDVFDATQFAQQGLGNALH